MKLSSILIITLLMSTNSWAIEEVFWYKMNDDAANTIVVQSGSNGTAATLGGGDNTDAINSTGKINGALNLNKVDDFIDTNVQIESFFQNDFSYSGWFNYDDGRIGLQVMFGVRDNAASGGDSRCLASSGSDGDMRIEIRVDGGAVELSQTAEGIIVDGPTGFLFFAATCNWTSGACLIYLDSVLQGNDLSSADLTNLTAANLDFAQDTAVGARNSTGTKDAFFGGDIDDFRLFDGVLTQAQIDLIYNSGSGTEDSLATLEGGPPTFTTLYGATLQGVTLN